MAEIDIDRALQHRQKGGYTVEEVEAGLVDPSQVTYIYKVETLSSECVADMLNQHGEYLKAKMVEGAKMGGIKTNEFRDGNGY
jgi:hypothetical protein